MKRTFLIVVALACAAAATQAQDQPTPPTPSPRVQVPFEVHVVPNSTARYYFKVDTRTGQVWQVQAYGLKSLAPPNASVTIPDYTSDAGRWQKILAPAVNPDNVSFGRFAFKADPTSSSVFLLLDQFDGRVWVINIDLSKEPAAASISQIN